MMIDDYEIIFESKIDFRKYLILKLKTRGNSEHYHVFLTDGILSKNGNLIYIIVSLSSSKLNYDDTYTIKKENPLHPDLPPIDGFISFKDARMMTEKEILKSLVKETSKVKSNFGYENTDTDKVDDILDKFLKSKADPHIKRFYRNYLKRIGQEDASNIVETLNKLLYEPPEEPTKIGRLLQESSKPSLRSRWAKNKGRSLRSEILSRSKRNRRIRESYRDY